MGSETFKRRRVVAALAQTLRITLTLASCSYNGNTTYEEAHAFFRPALSDLHDPFPDSDMDLAIDRLDARCSE